MKFKKLIAGVTVLAIAAALLPKLVTSNVLNAAETHSQQAVFFSDGTMTMVSEGAKIVRPNSSIIVEDGDFTYVEQKDGTLWITDYNGEITDVVFPSEIGGKTVTRISLNDAANQTITVTIPASVSVITFSMIGSYSSLKEIIVDKGNANYSSRDGILFNKNFTELVRYPSGKAAEELEYTIPDTVIKLSWFAFNLVPLTAVNATDTNTAYSSEDGVLFNKNKTELVLYPQNKQGKEYIVPNTVTQINNGAFSGCQHLTSIVLQEGLEIIKHGSISSCQITELNIPASVSEIETGAIQENYNLKSISVDSGNKNYFTENGVLFNNDASVLILCPSDKADDSYIIPDTVITIGNSAFSYSKIKEFIFGKNVLTIELTAFDHCQGKSSVTLPDSIKNIENLAFYACLNLTSVTIPAGVEKMGNITNEYTEDYYSSIYFTNIFEACPNELVIHGTPGTVAEKYAIFWGIQFNENPILSDDKNDTGVNVMLPEGSVPDGTVLNVEKKTADEYPDSIIYDITLTKDGQAVQPTGKVSVKIPVPTGMDENNIKIYYRDENGKLVDMKAVVTGSYLARYIVFTTDHFSEYIVTTEKLIPDTIIGDINGNRKVNSEDVILLNRYLAEWGNEIDETAADVNGDGKIDPRDSIALARMLLD